MRPSQDVWMRVALEIKSQARKAGWKEVLLAVFLGLAESVVNTPPNVEGFECVLKMRDSTGAGWADECKGSDRSHWHHPDALQRKILLLTKRLSLGTLWRWHRARHTNALQTFFLHWHVSSSGFPPKACHRLRIPVFCCSIAYCVMLKFYPLTYWTTNAHVVKTVICSCLWWQTWATCHIHAESQPGFF